MTPFSFYIFLIFLIFVVVGIKVMEWRAQRLTASVCHLYETLKVVADKMKDEEILLTPHVLTYQNKNHEINELHLAFNSVVKTMVVAHNPGGDTHIALLNYSDAYYIE